MIIFGDNNIVPYLLGNRERYFVLNFFNPTNLGTRISNMFLPQIIRQTCDLESPQFDMAYAKYLLEDNNAFQDFMEILMSMYYNENDNVLILTDLSSSLVTAMCESIIKLIQQRYGYNCYIANCPEDIMTIPESEMSEMGMKIFLQDKERYSYLSSDAKHLLSITEIVGGESDKCI
jgi:hypothetical protein